MSFRFVLVVAVAAALCCCNSLTAKCASPSYSLPHTLVIDSGTLPEARALARLRLRPGEWAYDFNPGEEAAFFETEDAASRQWQTRKKELSWVHAYRLKLRQAKVSTDSHTTTHGSTVEKNTTTRLSAEYFSDRNVKRRQKERLKKRSQIRNATASAVADARVVLEDEIESLWRHFQTSGASDTANDQRYLGIVERHFSHTLVNKSAERVFVTSSLFSPSLLQVPLVVEAELLPSITSEIAQVRLLWKKLHHKAPAPADSAAQLEEHLTSLSTVVEDSKRVAAAVAILAHPVAEEATRWVLLTLTGVGKAIVANDESTEAKRVELKHFLKQQSLLRKLKLPLEKYVKIYSSAMLQGEGLTGEAMLFALQLIAKLRFGDEMSGLLEGIPALSTTAPFTGLLEHEWWVHVLRPYAVCGVLTIVLMWVAQELKGRFLYRVRASRLSAPSIHLSGVSVRSWSRARQIFMLISLVELIVPYLMPVIVLLVHLHGARMWAWSVMALMRPSQRLICLAATMFLSLLNHVIAVVVRRLFDMVDPAAYRLQLAKKK